MDLLQGVQDMDEGIAMNQGEGEVPNIPNMDDMPMPTVEDLLKALDGMTGMSDEDKEQLREQLMNPQTLGSMGMNPKVGFQNFSQFLYLMILLLIVAFIFVFFGYKLYKSLADKERKRDEKRRIKQMKKKK